MRALAILALSGCAMSAGLGSAAPTSASAPGVTANHASDLVVPDLINHTLDEARAITRTAGFMAELEVVRASCEGNDPIVGHVQCQSPAPGTQVTRGGFIQVALREPPGHPGMILRGQARPAVGMTIEAARAHFKQLGHDGPVRVDTVLHYDAHCAAGRVCAIEKEGETGIHDEIVLLINPKLEIAPPP